MDLRRRFQTFVSRLRRKRTNPENNTDFLNEIRLMKHLQYDFDTIKIATNNFSITIGQGGFGRVYKGKFPDGQEVAIKRYNRSSCQGDEEFQNEVVLGTKLYHKNLVRVLGFCIKGRERLIVYEFVPNLSLDRFLFDPIKRTYLDWETRYKIICGISKVILYLHEDIPLRIIHRNIKAANILLDEDMNPKISDFDTAISMALDEDECNISRIVGTSGYIAPEYIRDGQLSVKIDVFSFGVLVLEIVSGRKVLSRIEEPEQHLLNYAWTNWQEGTTLNVVDPVVTSEPSSMPEILRCIHVALLCVQENAANRPTMSNVVLMLSGFYPNFPIPSEPAYFRHYNDIINNPHDSPLQEIANYSSSMSQVDTDDEEFNPR